MKKFFKNQKVLVATVSASIFGVWHLVAYNAANEAMISAGIFGLLTYYLTDRTNNLMQAILIHIILNTVVIAGSLGMLTLPIGGI